MLNATIHFRDNLFMKRPTYNYRNLYVNRENIFMPIILENIKVHLWKNVYPFFLDYRSPMVLDIKMLFDRKFNALIPLLVEKINLSSFDIEKKGQTVTEEVFLLCQNFIDSFFT